MNGLKVATITDPVTANIHSLQDMDHAAEENTNILLVNVDLLTTRIISAILEEDGYKIIHEPDIKFVAGTLQQLNISLLLMMCRKPAVSCLKYCRECLSFCELIERDFGTPIIVLGTADSSEIKTDVRNAGATDFITWPVEPAELLARVSAVLRIGKRVKSGSVLQEILPGFELDSNRQAVILQGREKRLSTIEFRLLCYLILHSNRICKREELLRAVWGWADVSSDREVDVYICYLRKKLEENSRASRHLRTVRSIGYLFQP